MKEYEVKIIFKTIKQSEQLPSIIVCICPPSTTHTPGAELWTLRAAIHVQKTHHVFQLLNRCEHCEQGCSNLSQRSLGTRFGC